MAAFVGRIFEMQQHQDALDRAKLGRGQVIALERQNRTEPVVQRVLRIGDAVPAQSLSLVPAPAPVSRERTLDGT